MNYETIKTFILIVLVGISFFLTFVLWSYQPNYEDFYDTSYVNEVDIGGTEKTKSDLIKPDKVVFRNAEKAQSFINPTDRQAFYKDLTSWVLNDYEESESEGRPDENELFIEIIFPSAIPASLLTNLFNFYDEIDLPNWSFNRMFITFDEERHILKLTILSVDNRKQISAKIEQSEIYDEVLDYMNDTEQLHENVIFGSADTPIYLPKEKVKLSKKTLVATNIDPDLFINALFSNPSLVKPNIREAYFTDGQRGMKIVQEGLHLEFINPIQSTHEVLEPIELMEKSVSNINEHKGWTNEYLFEGIIKTSNYIRYRLYYEGYPVFNYHSLSVIEQKWREQELHEYNRPLIKIGNLLNTQDVELPSDQEVVNVLMNGHQMKLENINDIRVGYYLNYIEDAHSLTLEPSWYILYQDNWIKFNQDDFQNDTQVRGGD